MVYIARFGEREVRGKEERGKKKRPQRAATGAEERKEKGKIWDWDYGGSPQDLRRTCCPRLGCLPSSSSEEKSSLLLSGPDERFLKYGKVVDI
ncbi:hypothetical protein BS78_05G100900 [Paspalum vaginatum]|nr:hypothetical protein BS78_05G100900 [Paspalum vaginatum]